MITAFEVSLDGDKFGTFWVNEAHLPSSDLLLCRRLGFTAGVYRRSRVGVGVNSAPCRRCSCSCNLTLVPRVSLAAGCWLLAPREQRALSSSARMYSSRAARVPTAVTDELYSDRQHITHPILMRPSASRPGWPGAKASHHIAAITLEQSTRDARTRDAATPPPRHPATPPRALTFITNARACSRVFGERSIGSAGEESDF